MQINIKTDQIQAFEKKLSQLNQRGIPYAVRAATSQSAYKAQQHARKGVKASMVLRNKYTIQSIRYDRATSVQKPEAKVGSVVGYMAQQEHGADLRKRGGVGRVIPTSVSAGQSRKKKPRTKTVRIQNLLRQVKLNKSPLRRPLSYKQRMAVAIKYALRGNGFFYMQTPRKKGLFHVTAGRKGLNMVYDLTEQVVRLKRREWLNTAVKKTIPEMPKIYLEALDKQIRRYVG